MNPKYKKLLISIFLDGVGMLSFIIPGLGEFIDIIWAPLSAFLILKLYTGTFSKVASLISFGEEAGFFGEDGFRYVNGRQTELLLIPRVKDHQGN